MGTRQAVTVSGSTEESGFAAWTESLQVCGNDIILTRDALDAAATHLSTFLQP